MKQATAPRTTRQTLCPARDYKVVCETPMACGAQCRYADDPVHPNRIEVPPSASQPADDVPFNEWLALIGEVYAIRSALGFSARLRFDNALRPRFEQEPGKVIAYPDAFYHITQADVTRAKETLNV